MTRFAEEFLGPPSRAQKPRPGRRSAVPLDGEIVDTATHPPTEYWRATGERRLVPAWFGFRVVWEHEMERFFLEVVDRYTNRMETVRRTHWSRNPKRDSRLLAERF